MLFAFSCLDNTAVLPEAQINEIFTTADFQLVKNLPICILVC